MGLVNLVDKLCRGGAFKGPREFQPQNTSERPADVVEALDDGLEVALVASEVWKLGDPGRQGRRKGHVAARDNAAAEVLAHRNGAYKGRLASYTTNFG